MKGKSRTAYKTFQEGGSTLIVKEGFERLCKILDWKRPSQMLSCSSLLDMRQGRGKALAISLEEGQKIFMKKLLHGGLFRNLLKDIFLKKRILENFRNAERLRREGFASPDIMFIIMKKKMGIFYEGYVGEEWLIKSQDLLEMIKKEEWPSLKKDVLHTIASELKKFHDKGFYHSDLNAGNIIIRKAMEKTPEEKYEVFFIDLDKLKIYRKIRYGKRRRNIFRLFRSMKKMVRRKRDLSSDELYFLQCYCQTDKKMLSSLVRFLPLHRLWLLFHYPYWKLGSRK